MSNILNIIKEEERSNILKNLSLILNEKEEVIVRVLPVWNTIILASLVKLTRNRIRFSALQNFIQQHSIPTLELESLKNSVPFSSSDGKIFDYGESLMGILIPDKKSAIASALSQHLSCRSSLVLKGLSVIYTLYGEFLLNEYSSILEDWKGYVEYVSNFKNSIFDENISEKVQKSISEILILSEIFKDSSSGILHLSDDTDAMVSGQEERKAFFLKPIVVITCMFLVFVSAGVYWFMNYKNEDVENINEDIEEIIPLDSLNKLNDSLTKSVIDSNRIKNDSLVTLSWPKGKEFQVPQNSSIVKIHAYLSDSTQTESLQVSCTDLSFDEDTDQLKFVPEYFIKRLVEGLNKYRAVKIKLYTFSANGGSSSTKRGFLFKNRLVGEGLSPRRIEVSSNSNAVKSEPTKSLNEQVLIEFVKE